MSVVAEPLTVVPEQELQTKALEVLRAMNEVVITDHASYLVAAEQLKTAAATRRRIEEFFKPMKEAAFAAHRAVCAREKEMLDKVSSAERQGRFAIGIYENEQQRIIEEQRRRAEETARIEQVRLQAIADEDNRKALAEAQRIADEQRLEMASHIQEQGATAEEIEEVLSAPVVAQAPVYVAPMVAVAPPVPTFQRAAGLTAARKNFKARVTNIIELAAYVLKNPQFANLIQGNEQALNAMAKANEMKLAIPGVAPYNDTTSVGVRR